jgi:hypothetical protein
MTERFSRRYALGIAVTPYLEIAPLAFAQTEPTAGPQHPPSAATDPSKGSTPPALPPLPPPPSEPPSGSSEPTDAEPHRSQTAPDPDDTPPRSPPVRPSRECRNCNQGLVLDGWLGAGSTRVIQESGWSGFAGIGFTGLYHYESFELGAEGRLGFALFGPTSTILAAMVGGKTEPAPWLRLELLAEVGEETLSNVGADLFTNVSGDSGATRPYLGGRASVSFLLGRAHRFLLGWWLNAGDAIGTTIINPSVQTCFLGCSTSERTYTIGGPSLSMGIRIGGEAAVF